jgi:hypothetical protein
VLFAVFNAPVLAKEHLVPIMAAEHSVISACLRIGLGGHLAKHKISPHVSEREDSTRFKILNPKYSQKEGREELFERDRHTEPVGWHSRAIACEAGA